MELSSASSTTLFNSTGFAGGAASSSDLPCSGPSFRLDPSVGAGLSLDSCNVCFSNIRFITSSAFLRITSSLPTTSISRKSVRRHTAGPPTSQDTVRRSDGMPASNSHASAASARPCATLSDSRSWDDGGCKQVQTLISCLKPNVFDLQSKRSLNSFFKNFDPIRKHSLQATFHKILPLPSPRCGQSLQDIDGYLSDPSRSSPGIAKWPPA